MTLLLIVLLPFIGAVPPLLVRHLADARARAAWLVAVPALLALSLVLMHTPAIFAGEVLTWRQQWLPALGLDLTLRMDGYAWLFSCLVLGIGLLIVLYARYYLSAEEAVGRFFTSLMLFMGSMLGVVLAGNLILLILFWELTSLSSFLLIGFWRHEEEARYGARMALVVTGLGGLALLGGLVLLGNMVGSYDLDVVLASAAAVKGHSLYVPMLLLVLLGAFTKSAQFPFQFWLPRAMAAPTPVSAYLHSATMVKAGVFLLGRLYPVLSGTEVWFYVVTLCGLTTLLIGAYAAMFAHDLKGLLAYSTVSHLGLITLLFGFGTPVSALAAVFHIINHATFKASLFMAAGIIDHETGTRDMRILNGLRKHMPITATLAIVAAAAMAGVPLLNGFLSKEMFLAESLNVARPGGMRFIEPLGATIASILSVAYSVRFISIFFRGDGTAMPRTPHEPPRWMRVPVEALVVLCIAVGLLPGLLIDDILRVAGSAVLAGAMPDYHVAVWHGFNLPLLMSAIALAGGTLLYFNRQRLYALHDGANPRVSAERVYDALDAGAARVSTLVTRGLENGSLQRYAMMFIAAAVVLGGVPALAGGFLADEARLAGIGIAEVAVWLILLASAGTVVALHRRRFVALVAISVVGLAVTLTFVRLGAPDLALTQLLVEIVTIMLVLLALDYLPKTTPMESSTRRRVRDAVLATAAGFGVASLSWAVMTRPQSTISDYFIEQSKPLGGGYNIVNVILVDFRGFDTMGEIAVLSIAAFGVIMLLRGVELARARTDGPQALDRAPLILTMIARALVPFVLMFAAFLFLRGHNLPGGGFVAGLMGAVALILQYVASGTGWTEKRLDIDYRPVAAAGVLIAALTGLGALFFGYPFLSATFAYFDIPLIGEVELATAMLFDLGVFLAVVGAVMLMLYRLGAPVPHDREDAELAKEASPWKP